MCIEVELIRTCHIYSRFSPVVLCRIRYCPCRVFYIAIVIERFGFCRIVGTPCAVIPPTVGVIVMNDEVHRFASGQFQVIFQVEEVWVGSILCKALYGGWAGGGLPYIEFGKRAAVAPLVEKHRTLCMR